VLRFIINFLDIFDEIWARVIICMASMEEEEQQNIYV
jgi:hypothetical protein